MLRVLSHGDIVIVACMGESRNACMIISLKVGTPAGRPKHRWEDDFKMSQRSIYENGDWIPQKVKDSVPGCSNESSLYNHCRQATHCFPFLAEAVIFLFSIASIHTSPAAHPLSYPVDSHGLFLLLKQLWYEADHSTPCSTGVKNK
jgi:hypothetical protein